MPLKPGLLSLLLLLFTTVTFATTFTVTSNADSGPGTLREALQNAAANGTATPDLIVFNIPYSNTASITIQLASLLPDVTDNLTIDASSQPSPKLGVSDARIIIEPQGVNNYITMLGAGLTLRDADNVQIFGLCIEYFSEYTLSSSLMQPMGVLLMNANNLVFGAPGKGNVIAGCTYGLFKAYTAGTTNNIKVQSNIFGLDVDGTTKLLPTATFTNYVGVELTLAKDALIGGPTAAEGNLFSGDVNGLAFIEQSGTVEISNNKFNTDYTGDQQFAGSAGAMGARDGSANFFIHDNIVAGESDFNVMSGRFLVVKNYFGTNPSRTVEFTSAGGILDFNNCTGAALIGGNDASTMNVFGNGVLGVGNNNSTKVTVLHNSFYCHDNDGIYMSWYTLPNKPFITINKLTAGSVLGTARPNSIIELYQTDNCRHCEGLTYITRFNADASGNWSYSGPLPPNVTATATNDKDSTTSAFAQPILDVSAAVITDATCNKSNGKITGMRVSSGTSFSWTDINGNVVGTDTNLINVPAGQYQLAVGIGANTCKTYSQYFTVGNTLPPQIDPNAFTSTQPSCGAFNGSISYTGSIFPDAALWFSPAGDTLQHGLLLEDAGEGDYFFRIVVPADTSCHTTYGPVSLANQSGPTVVITGAAIQPAACGKPNGSITNIRFSNITGQPVYRWYDSLSRLVAATPDLLNVPPGKYLLKFKDQGPCDTITTSYIKVGNAGIIRFDVTARKIAPEKCSGAGGSILNITVTNGLTYKWIDAKTRTVISTNLDLTGAPVGDYKLIATSPLGCIDSTEVIHVPLAVAETFFVSSIGGNPEHCGRKDGSVYFTPSDPSQTGFTFQWIDNATGQVISTNTSAQALKAGDYIAYSIDGNGCTKQIGTVNLIDEAPSINSASAAIRADICKQQIGSIKGIDIQGGSPLTYTWYDAADQPVSNNKDLVNVGSGTYYLVVNDPSSCSDKSAMFTIRDANELVAAPVYKTIYLRRGSPANLVPVDPGPGTYELYAGLRSVAPDQKNTTGSFTTGPVYNDTTVYVTLRFGTCSSIASPVAIHPVETFDIIMPNAFTPNNDGHNDLFRVKYPELVSTMQMVVFNRWGQKIFESADPAKGWDGNYRGVQQPADTYVWTISYTDIIGGKKKIAGTVLLVR